MHYVAKRTHRFVAMKMFWAISLYYENVANQFIISLK